MQTYRKNELTSALAQSGLGDGDLVYLSTRLFNLGHMADSTNRRDFLEKIFDSIRAVIGPLGTIVVPTFTQQVSDYGAEYVHETTPCQTGLFGEYIRGLETSVRSLHPVFSVAANGPLAKDICHDVSPVAFGTDCAFDRIIQLGGKSTCIGFGRESGQIVSLMHFVETSFAVPYFYTKFVDAHVFASGERVNRNFFINVKYLDFDISFSFLRYISELRNAGLVGHASLGGGDIFTTDGRKLYDVGINLLKKDVYAFLKSPPTFVPGRIPCDGLSVKNSDYKGVNNWIGLGLSGQ